MVTCRHGDGRNSADAYVLANVAQYQKKGKLFAMYALAERQGEGE